MIQDAFCSNFYLLFLNRCSMSAVVKALCILHNFCMCFFTSPQFAQKFRQSTHSRQIFITFRTKRGRKNILIFFGSSIDFHDRLCYNQKRTFVRLLKPTGCEPRLPRAVHTVPCVLRNKQAQLFRPLSFSAQPAELRRFSYSPAVAPQTDRMVYL